MKMVNTADVEAALSLNKSMLNGQEIEIEKAKNKEDDKRENNTNTNTNTNTRMRYYLNVSGVQITIRLKR